MDVRETLELYKTANDSLLPLVARSDRKALKQLVKLQSLQEQGDHFALRRPEGGEKREQQEALLATLPSFRYHPNPLDTEAFLLADAPVACSCCGKSTRSWKKSWTILF